MAFAVSRKTRELGIRIALGARAAALQRSKLMRALRLAATGSLIGAIGAAWLSRFIGSLLYDVSRMDPATYTGAALVLVAIAAAAAYLPARRASTVDPMESLRAE